MLIQQFAPMLIGQEGWEWLGFGALGLICLVPIIWLVIAILLCIWVYRDAESRGMSGALWLIIVLVAGLLGFIIYLVVRKDKTQNKGAPPPPP